MIADLPFWIHALFFFAVFYSLSFFYLANKGVNRTIVVILIWTIIHSSLAYTGFYQDTKSIPPRFALVLFPATLAILIGNFPRQLNKVIPRRNRVFSTLLHTVRIPVELVLFGLYQESFIPLLMTFEGRNFDIVMGLSAPIMALLIYKQKIGLKLQLAWNLLGFFLVNFILINGIFSAEMPFQLFAFDQPNRAISYFPFILLPALIVPLVVYSHVSDIRIIIKELKAKEKLKKLVL